MLIIMTTRDLNLIQNPTTYCFKFTDLVWVYSQCPYSYLRILKLEAWSLKPLLSMIEGHSKGCIILEDENELEDSESDRSIDRLHNYVNNGDWCLSWKTRYPLYFLVCHMTFLISLTWSTHIILLFKGRNRLEQLNKPFILYVYACSESLWVILLNPF